MDHSEAVRTQAAERYVLGELEQGQREAYEEHFFSCQRCAAEVHSAALFADAATEVLREEPLGRVAQAEKGGSSPGWLRFFWPVPAGALSVAVLLLAVTAFQGLVTLPELRDELTGAKGLQPASWFFLSVSRAAPQVVSVPAHERRVGLTLSRTSEKSYPHYRCEVRTGDGRTVLSAVVPAPEEGAELQLLLPVEDLQPGPHVIVLHGLSAPDGEVAAPDFARYHFTVEPRGKQ